MMEWGCQVEIPKATNTPAFMLTRKKKSEELLYK